ncbi:MAG: prolipoprotein diacylglyceryl transferase, partial [Lentisphaeria bacterium]
LSNPLSIIKIWEGGLASHGGIAGIFIAIWIFTKKYPEFSKLYLLDRLALSSMIGAALIRIGNFFNSEIVGVPSLSKFAIIFKRISPQPLHPAQLYEAIAYLIIFIILLIAYFKSNIFLKQGMALGITMILVFIARFAVEFVKSSQSKLDGILSMGQLLSIPFILFGIYLVIKASKSAVFTKKR